VGHRAEGASVPRRPRTRWNDAAARHTPPQPSPEGRENEPPGPPRTREGERVAAATSKPTHDPGPVRRDERRPGGIERTTVPGLLRGAAASRGNPAERPIRSRGRRRGMAAVLHFRRPGPRRAARSSPATDRWRRPMAVEVPRRMTEDEFFVWQERQEDRYEFVDGLPVRPVRMMAGASRRHDQIVVSILLALGNRLRGGPCRPFTADTAVRTVAGKLRRPDVGVGMRPSRRPLLRRRPAPPRGGGALAFDARNRHVPQAGGVQGAARPRRNPARRAERAAGRFSGRAGPTGAGRSAPSRTWRERSSCRASASFCP
jgi:hypothetical protein